MKPKAYDFYCGLGGWTDGLLATGWQVTGFDIEPQPAYPGEFQQRDVRDIHGSELADADLIVASPPCQEFSYRAMPWKRAKALGSPVDGINLFWQCWRIQEEASEAKGEYIPLVVENVKGAQPWVGSARWHYGSFYLWGDVPAIMPLIVGRKGPGGGWLGDSGRQDPRDVRKQADGSWAATEVKNGNDWFGSGPACSLQRRFNSRSQARKAASAQIAKIPRPLAEHIGRVFFPFQDKARIAQTSG
jgi:hypothetical protein